MRDACPRFSIRHSAVRFICRAPPASAAFVQIENCCLLQVNDLVENLPSPPHPGTARWFPCRLSGYPYNRKDSQPPAHAFACFPLPLGLISCRFVVISGNGSITCSGHRNRNRDRYRRNANGFGTRENGRLSPDDRLRRLGLREIRDAGGRSSRGA